MEKEVYLVSLLNGLLEQNCDAKRRYHSHSINTKLSDWTAGKYQASSYRSESHDDRSNLQCIDECLRKKSRLSKEKPCHAAKLFVVENNWSLKNPIL